MDKNVIESPFQSVDIPDNLTISDFMFNRMEKYGNQPAMICSVTNKKLTFKDLIELTQRLITGLQKLGLKQNDVLGVCLPNCMEYLPLSLAVTALGAIFTTTNPIYTEYEILHHFNQCQVNYIVTNDETRQKILTLKQKCPSVRAVINIGVSNIATINFNSLTKTNNIKMINLPKINTKQDVAFYLSSSGTTGLPKAVMLTHYNIVANLYQILRYPSKFGDFTMFTPNSNEPYISIFPYFHVGGLVYAGLLLLKEGAINIVVPKYEQKIFLNLIEKYKPTLIVIPPPVLVFLTKSPLAKNTDVSSIKAIMCGAAPIGLELTEQACKKFNLKYIIEGYGMTELSPMSHLTPLGSISERKRGSCGVVVPNTLCKVIDIKTGKSLGPNEHGEICTKGPQLMKGYLGNLKETLESIDKDGWMHTGDTGFYDKDHFFYIVDRIKELIKVKGFQVAPAELENILLSHPAIEDVAVIGVPNEYAGELPQAHIIIKSGCTLTEDEVKKFLSDKVVSYKRLDGGVKFVDFIPKTPSGKILRRIMKQQLKDNDVVSKL